MISITAPVPAKEAIKRSLIPGERIVCSNATIIERPDGDWGWVDNDGYISCTVAVEDEQED